MVVSTKWWDRYLALGGGGTAVIDRDDRFERHGSAVTRRVCRVHLNQLVFYAPVPVCDMPDHGRPTGCDLCGGVPVVACPQCSTVARNAQLCGRRLVKCVAVTVLRWIRENGATCLSTSTGAFTFTAPGMYRVG